MRKEQICVAKCFNVALDGAAAVSGFIKYGADETRASVVQRYVHLTI